MAHLGLIERLLAEERIDVNMQDKYGNTALSNACEVDLREVVTLLLANERVSLEAGQGCTCLKCPPREGIIH